uniref:Guanylate cyclase n=1 Tax=Plectus sambesii TaxID=2011161 RepID=A0A914XEL8_9BILA
MDPVAQLAAAWNVPIIGYLSNDEKFADKTIFDTLARTSLISSNYLGQAISMFLANYNWKKVALITTVDTGTQIYRNGLVQAFQTYGTIINLELILNQSLSARDYTEQGVYEQIKANARVVVFILGVDISSAMEFLKGAQQANMTGIDSEYILLTAWVDNTDTYTKQAWQNDDLSVNATALNLYHGVLAIHVRGLEPQVTQNFSDWFSNQTGGLTSNPRHLMPLYDAVCLYAMALKKSIEEEGSLLANTINNGTKMWSYMRHQDFQCSSVPVLTNNVADRLSSYSVYRIRSDRALNDSGYFELIAYLDAIKKPQCNDSFEVKWTNCFDLSILEFTSITAILDEPICGYKDERCNHTVLYVIIAAVGVTIAFVIIATIAYRQYRLKKVFLTPWLIPRDMIQMLDIVKKSDNSILSFDTGNKSMSTGDRIRLSSAKRAIVGVQHVVVNKYAQNSHITFNQRQLAHLYQLKQLNHENLNSFIGLSYNEQNELITCWQFCNRGSLEDILHASEMELDEAFKASFIKDVIAGLHYIHSSAVEYHGALTAGACLVDSRWTVKLSDFGLQSMLTHFSANKILTETNASKMKAERKIRMAPEHLKKLLLTDEFTGSQEGDIYSLGLLIFEILLRREPFGEYAMTATDIVDKLCHPSGSILRPKFDQSQNFELYFMNMVRLCWDEHPVNRPPLRQVQKVIERSLAISKGSLVDQMIKRLEKYAANLERIVKDRTALLEEAREQADNLLGQLLPRSIAEELKHGRHVEPQTYELATVLFSDIAGFTKLCSDSSPLQIVTFLNDMFSGFDQIIASHDAYKVETIGDAYMIVSGVPKQNGMQNIVEIADIALKMRHQMHHFVVAHRPDTRMKIRIGFHSGSVAAGVIGLAAPRYCLFGDTVNMASRMESTGEAGEIQFSDKSHTLLKRWPEFLSKARGQVEVKGKGKCETFWLQGKADKQTFQQKQKQQNFL